MKIFVKVKPNSAKDSVEQVDTTHYVISVTAPPINNRANDAVVKIMADYIGVAKSAVTIKRGQKSKQKTLEIISSKEMFG